MEFYQDVNLSTPASDGIYSSSEVQYRLNSLYRPAAAASTTTLGFSTLSGIYARWRVDRVRVVIKFHTSTNNAWTVAAVVPPSSTVSTNGISIDQAGHNPFMAQDMLEKASTGTPQSYVHYQKEFSIAQLMGYSQKEYEAQMSLVTGTDTTNPTSGFIPYLLVNCANRGSNTSTNVSFEVRLIYDCTWFEPDVLLA